MDVFAGLSTFISVWLGLWVIPAAMPQANAKVPGSYVNRKTSLYFLMLISMNVMVMFPIDGWSGTWIIKVIVLSLLPFVAACFMLRFYHAQPH